MIPAGVRCRLDEETLRRRARGLAWLLLDVDGVLTDGKLYYGPGDLLLKAFDTKDGLGLKLAREAGLSVGLLSGRADAATLERARELKLDDVRTGDDDKALGFARFLAEHRLDARAVAYAGDDLPDLPVLERCGLAVAPADAVEAVRAKADIVLSRGGGDGAVRELVELLLAARGPAANERA